VGLLGHAKGYWLILLLGFSWLALLLVLVVAVDVLNLRTITSELARRDGEEAVVLWSHLFAEGGAAEVMQWLMLGLAAALAFFASGWLRGIRANVRLERFWLIMGMALLLMLMEDAGNVRQAVSIYAGMLLGGAAGSAGEYLVFALIALVPGLAVLWYWRLVWQLRRTRILLLGGFVAYGAAGIGSALRRAWYEPAGWWVHEWIFAGRIAELPGVHYGFTHGFWLMDFLVEETMELIGATLMAAAVAAFYADAGPCAAALQPEQAGRWKSG